LLALCSCEWFVLLSCACACDLSIFWQVIFPSSSPKTDASPLDLSADLLSWRLPSLIRASASGANSVLYATGHDDGCAFM